MTSSDGRVSDRLVNSLVIYFPPKLYSSPTYREVPGGEM
jgi:hypothetical protein|tara:strand:+ start:169 stop:285 length:117 start_codon:yes stop_codon:yes gene_type:complete